MKDGPLFVSMVRAYFQLAAFIAPVLMSGCTLNPETKMPPDLPLFSEAGSYEEIADPAFERECLAYISSLFEGRGILQERKTIVHPVYGKVLLSRFRVADMDRIQEPACIGTGKQIEIVARIM